MKFLDNLSQAIAKKIGREAEIINIEKISGGFHSEAFKIALKDQPDKPLFLKTVKSSELGFEYPERKIASLLLSHSMARQADANPRSLGVFLADELNIRDLGEIGEATEVYQLQEFQTGSDYWSRLQQRKNKPLTDAIDQQEIKAIVEYINKIHSSKNESLDISLRQALYNSALRDVLIHPELTMKVLFDYPADDPLLGRSRQSEYIDLMLGVIYHWRDRADRLAGLHGDFWGTNLFFKEDGSVFGIDFSRIPWGDPGIDIGWWLAQYLWLYHETGNRYFRELGEAFLQEYERQSGDREIRQAVSIALGFCGAVYITPKFYPQLDIELRVKFLDNIKKILADKNFCWPD